MANPLPSLSNKELLILEMLTSKDLNGCKREMYGLEMVEASKGELKRGTIYVTLQRMTDKGYVASRVEPRTQPEIGIPRRLYSITGLGEVVFKAYQDAARLLDALNPIPSEM